jgi:hypothetical protein
MFYYIVAKNIKIRNYLTLKYSYNTSKALQCSTIFLQPSIAVNNISLKICYSTLS